MMRLISYNVLDGFMFRDNTPDEGRRLAVAAWLAEMQPDVVAFQELNRYTTERLQREAIAWGHPHVALLKEGPKGYPTALTSRQPISAVQRLVKGFHHGFLRARTYGITFFALHLAPFERAKRLKEAEMLLNGNAGEYECEPFMGARTTMSVGEPLLLLGDFNSLSPAARDYHQETNLLANLHKRAQAPSSTLSDNGELDYSVMASFEAAGLIDLIGKHQIPARDFSFPTPFLNKQLPRAEIALLRRRLDYVMASPPLAACCRRAEVMNRDTRFDGMSDHFPLLLEFDWPYSHEG